VSRARRVYRKKIAKVIPYSVFIFIPIVLLLLIAPLFSQIGSGDSNEVEPEIEIISPLAASSGLKAIAQVIPNILSGDTNKKIEEIVSEELQGEKGTYSIIYKNLKNDDMYTHNPTQVYDSASLYKLFVMAKTYEDIESGKLNHDVVLNDTVERLNDRFDIASEEAELTEGSFRMTVDTALEQMITISHNYAALLLTSKLKSSEVKTFISRNGFIHTDFDAPPQTTAEDIVLFYEKLYKKELVNVVASDEMLALLRRQELNDRIPKYLPKTTQVAHKTGELGGVKHDAGIVFTEEGDYILVMMSDTNAPQHAAEVEAKISEKIYKAVVNK